MRKVSKAKAKGGRPEIAGVAILGRGRAGRALARSLRAAGIHVVFLPRRGIGPLRTRPVDLLVLAVPDHAIRSQARRLAKGGARCALAFHLSGALDASVLEPLARRGAATASFHPLRSFSGRPGEGFEGCAVAVEGDPKATRAARALARRLGAWAWPIHPGHKPLYHAAAALAAGGTATLTELAAGLARRAGMPADRATRAMADLAATAQQNLARRGFRDGLTGPVARGDRSTIALHRRALSIDPGAARLHKLLVSQALRLLRVDRGRSGR
jgi:predicted short-subunit dehydrogenase-like oxidoreductase (DUF2520 family)